MEEVYKYYNLNLMFSRPITLKLKIWGLSVSIEIAFSYLYTKFEPFSYCKKSGDTPLNFGPVGAGSLG